MALSILLEGVDDDLFINVDDEPFSCAPQSGDFDLQHCFGPVFEPGSEVTLKIFKNGKDIEPLLEIAFIVPDCQTSRSLLS
jgi:hypothetical protein